VSLKRRTEAWRHAQELRKAAAVVEMVEAAADAAAADAGFEVEGMAMVNRADDLDSHSATVGAQVTCSSTSRLPQRERRG
jgi:hypothetical protein